MGKQNWYGDMELKIKSPGGPLEKLLQGIKKATMKVAVERVIVWKKFSFFQTIKEQKVSPSGKAQALKLCVWALLFAQN